MEYGKFCVKFPHNRMKGEQHRLSPHSFGSFGLVVSEEITKN
jgi:hypothetical protein